MKNKYVRQFSHLLAGILIIIHCFNAFEKEEQASAFTFLSIAILFLLLSGLHPWLVRQVKKADAYLFFLEAAALYFSAWHYKYDGPKYMIVLSAVIATLFIIFGLYIFSLKKHRRRRHSSSTSSRSGLEQV